MRVLLAFLAASLAIAGDKPIPLPAPGVPTTRAALDTLRNSGMLVPYLRYYADAADFGARNPGYFPPGDGGVGKIWKDVTFMWNPGATLAYIVVDRENPKLPLPAMPGPNVNLEAIPATKGGEGFSHFSFGVYSSPVAMFLQQNLKCWPVITRLKIQEFTAEEGYRMELGTPDKPIPNAGDVPLAYLIEDPTQGDVPYAGRKWKVSWPRNWFIAELDGKLQAIPAGYIPPSCSSGKLDDASLVNAAQDLLANPTMSISQKAGALRALAGR